MTRRGPDEAVFWRLWTKYGQPATARHPHWAKLEEPDALTELRGEGFVLGSTLCELDLRFLSTVGLPAPEDWLGHFKFSPGTFYGTTTHRGTLLGHCMVWPLILSRLEDDVVLIKPERREVFYHARCVAHAVLLPLMFEETSHRMDGAKEQISGTDSFVLDLLGSLEEDIRTLDEKLLKERCYWPYRLFEINIDSNPTPPMYFPEGEEERPFLAIQVSLLRERSALPLV